MEEHWLWTKFNCTHLLWYIYLHFALTDLQIFLVLLPKSTNSFIFLLCWDWGFSHFLKKGVFNEEPVSYPDNANNKTVTTCIITQTLVTYWGGSVNLTTDRDVGLLPDTFSPPLRSRSPMVHWWEGSALALKPIWHGSQARCHDVTWSTGTQEGPQAYIVK